jgi:hypothetical protein
MKTLSALFTSKKMDTVGDQTPEDDKGIVSPVVHPTDGQKLPQPVAGALAGNALGPAPVFEARRERRSHNGAARLVAPAEALRHHRDDEPAGRTAEAPQQDHQSQQVASDVAVAPYFCAALRARWTLPLEGFPLSGYILSAYIRE